MFYSQFILAKKGPLGTIWIAAHLERKLRKNQVAETDIGVSVDSILFPEVPIALRLSGHLLLGVVRVYSRQVNYLFNDCSETLLKIKQAFQSTAVDLPPEATTAPFHSITLPETFDFDELELFPDSEGSLLRTNGHFVDHHVTTREQITLQDNLDNNLFLGSSQFGLDERFGDGNCSSMGLDFDEEFISGRTQTGGPSTSTPFLEEEDTMDPLMGDADRDQMDIDDPYEHELRMHKIDLNEERGSPFLRLDQSAGDKHRNQDSVFDEDRLAPAFELDEGEADDHQNTSNLSPLLEPLDEPVAMETTTNKVSDSVIFKGDTPNFHAYTPCTPDLNQEFCPPDDTSTAALLEETSLSAYKESNFEFGKSQTLENSVSNISCDLHAESVPCKQGTTSTPTEGLTHPNNESALSLTEQSSIPSPRLQQADEAPQHGFPLLHMQTSSDPDSSETIQDSSSTFKGFPLHKDLASENLGTLGHANVVAASQNIASQSHMEASSLGSVQQGIPSFVTQTSNQQTCSFKAAEESSCAFQGFPVHTDISSEVSRDVPLGQSNLAMVSNADSNQLSLPFQGFSIQKDVPAESRSSNLGPYDVTVTSQSMQTESQMQPSSVKATKDLSCTFQGFPVNRDVSAEGNVLLATQSSFVAVSNSEPHLQTPSTESSQQSFPLRPIPPVGQPLNFETGNDFGSTLHSSPASKDVSAETSRNTSQLETTSYLQASSAQHGVPLFPAQTFGHPTQDSSCSFQGFSAHKDVFADSGSLGQSSLAAATGSENSQPGLPLLHTQTFGQALSSSSEAGKDLSSSFQGFPLNKEVPTESSKDTHTNSGIVSQRVHSSQLSLIGNVQHGVSLLPAQPVELTRDSSSTFQGFPLRMEVAAESSREGKHPASPIKKPNESPIATFQNLHKPAFQKANAASLHEPGFLSAGTSAMVSLSSVPSRPPSYPSATTYNNDWPSHVPNQELTASLQQQHGTAISPRPPAWGAAVHTSTPRADNVMQNIANSQVSTSQSMHLFSTSGSMLPITNNASLYMQSKGINFEAAKQPSWHPAGQQPSESSTSSMASRMGPVETLRSAAYPLREDSGIMSLQQNMLHERTPALDLGKAQADMRHSTGVNMQTFQPQFDQTPVLREETPFDQTRKSPCSSSRSAEALPGDDDVLASILGRKRTNAFKLAPTPKENISVKKPRMTSRSLLKKRKIEIDSLAVLHGDVIRQQLEYTGDIRRERRKAPCTRHEVWSFEKEVQGQQNFDEPSLIGLASDLQDLYNDILGGIESKLSANLASSLKAPAPVEDTRKTMGVIQSQIDPMVAPVNKDPQSINGDTQHQGFTLTNADPQRSTKDTNGQSSKPMVNSVANIGPDEASGYTDDEGDTFVDSPGSFDSPRNDSDMCLNEALDGPQTTSQEELKGAVDIPFSQTSTGEANIASSSFEPQANVQEEIQCSVEAASTEVTIPESEAGFQNDVPTEDLVTVSVPGEQDELQVPGDAEPKEQELPQGDAQPKEQELLEVDVQPKEQEVLEGDVQPKEGNQLQVIEGDEQPKELVELQVLVGDEQSKEQNQLQVPAGDGQANKQVDLEVPAGDIHSSVPKESVELLPGGVHLSVPRESVELPSGGNVDLFVSNEPGHSMAGEDSHMSLPKESDELLPAGDAQMSVPKAPTDVQFSGDPDISVSEDPIELLALGETHAPESDKALPDAQGSSLLDATDEKIQEGIKLGDPMDTDYAKGHVDSDSKDIIMLEGKKLDEEKLHFQGSDQGPVTIDHGVTLNSSVGLGTTTEEREPVQALDVDEKKTGDDVEQAKDKCSDFFANEDNTDFLADDDDDDDIAYADLCEDGSGEEHVQIQENSGWSVRTRNVGRYLKTIFEGMENNPKLPEDQSNPTLGLNRLLAHKTKKEAARMFFETLVLKTRDYIQVEQKTPFEDIHLYPKTKLMKTSF